MRPRALAPAGLLALAACLAGLPSLGWSDDAAKQARKDLKKNVKRLQQVEQALAKAEQELDQVFAAARMQEADKQRAEGKVRELRDAAGELLVRVREADDADAAQALLGFAVSFGNPDVFEQASRELAALRSDEAIGALAEVLGQGVVDEPGGRRRPAGGKRADDVWKGQVVVARAFAAIDHPATIPPVAGQVARGTAPAVVNACVEAAARKPDKRVVTALVAHLGRVEKQGGWEYQKVRQALVDLTGEDFMTQERWQGWWSSNEASWDPNKRGEAKEAATRERGPQEQAPTFFESTIESNRLVFVLDVSGSMTMTDRGPEDTQTDEQYAKLDPDTPAVKARKRIERAKAQTIAAIQALGPAQRFNVIAFSDSNKAWKPAVVEATPQNKAQAVEFVSGLRDDGGTHTDDALKLAFADPAVDTIYLLTDGAPMKKLGNPGEQMRQFAQAEVRKILEWVKRENRFRGVKINTFGMDGPGVWHGKWGPRPVTLPTEPEWLAILSGFVRELANLTGGTFKSI